MKNLMIEGITVDQLEQIIANAVKTQIDSMLNNQSAEKDILNMDEAASFLNLSKSVLYKKTSNNTIPFYKKCKRVYYKRKDFEEWISTGKTDYEEDDGIELIFNN